MTTALTFRSVTSTGLQWWEWGKIIGFWSFVLCGLLTVTGYQVPTIVWAIALHLFMDFTIQSDTTAMKKAKGNIPVILMHSIISGGYPGILFGFAAMIVSIAAHLLIDLTRKFWLPDPAGPIADQTAHLITILYIGFWLT